MVDSKLLKIITCPKCKKDVILKEGKIICTVCGRRYPEKNNIPIMIVEEAELNGNAK